MEKTYAETKTEEPLDFIRNKVNEDITNNKNDGKVVTRFPPEPNGYLHIGHAKAFCLNFGIAKELNGKCHLRFDDTNPVKEDDKYIQAIKRDIHWMGYDWGDNLFYASDYYEKLYEFAVELIKMGKAFVCDLSMEEIKEYRGTLTTPGKESPYRNRSIEENLDLFKRMRNGEFTDGAKTLRAKIDMNSTNIHMRDPAMYRIKHVSHHRTGDKWCIYPMYDFAHCLSDAIEGITHSLCSLEFEIHRPLYDWFLEKLNLHPRPQQIEFNRLNLTYTVMSKRKLIKLVEENKVFGWDDPRMPTVSGMRRRGYTPRAIKNFVKKAGLTKREQVIDVSLLEYCVREDLNKTSPRVMGVLNPVKVIIDNYPEGRVEEMTAVNNPEDETMGTRKVPFSKELYIEKEDFREEAPRKFFRMVPGREVRLRYAYIVKCTRCTKDENGEITEIHCTVDPESRGGTAPDGRKVKGTLHWVSAQHALKAEVRLYDRLFKRENPESDGHFIDDLNSDSLKVLPECFVEPYLKNVKPEDRIQFERIGYFCVDEDSKKDKPVFNRTVPLRDSWAKKNK
ncbi:MAG: glutamine--tRNA ligase/YqeY domain fusion protein [Victivallales bacterium]|nr:glutamine--tRNA ligase/YqeY domain fusion protein [Victivallales bacterium]MCF7888671.1 glutamine--tRNA ligase/YqeY domain fusion protein [Victivallales bacterium]